MELTKEIEILFILCSIVLICLILAGIDIWRTRRRLMKKKLKREQVYDLAFTGDIKDCIGGRKTGLSAGMKKNTFLNNEGKVLDTDKYRGFLVFGHDLESCEIYHDELIFVKNNFSPEDFEILPELIIVYDKLDNYYALREVYEVKGKDITVKNMKTGKKSKITIDNVVGIVEYDFKIQ